VAEIQSLEPFHYRDFEHLELLAKQVVEGFITGLHKSPFHGFSVEFSEHRIYNPGESIRNIDWKLFARTDRLYTKRYEEETNLRCRILLDTSGSMFYPRERMRQVENPAKFLFSATATLALMNLLKRQRDAVALSLFGREDFHSQVGSTYQHHKALATKLSQVLEEKSLKGEEQVSLSDQLHLMAERTERRSLIIIFSDLLEVQDDPQVFLDALQHLKHGKHEVVLFHTLDRETETDFDFQSGPHKFVDLETGQELRLNPADIQGAYQEQMKAFRDLLRRKCLQYRIDLHEVDVKDGYSKVLQSYLLKRKKLY
tara:strand:+ start:1713 stop:2651 length:939 start_codon:yes stop_codon:yes gene_type:complete